MNPLIFADVYTENNKSLPCTSVILTVGVGLALVWILSGVFTFFFKRYLVFWTNSNLVDGTVSFDKNLKNCSRLNSNSIFSNNHVVFTGVKEIQFHLFVLSEQSSDWFLPSFVFGQLELIPDRYFHLIVDKRQQFFVFFP